MRDYKAQRYDGVFNGQRHNQSLDVWTEITGKSRGYFEYRLSTGERFQQALDRIQPKGSRERREFLYGMARL